MNIFILYPVVAVISLLVWFVTVRIVYSRRGNRQKKQQPQAVISTVSQE